MIIPWQPQVLGRAFQVIEPFWSTLFVQSGCFHELSSEHLQLVQNGNQKTTPDKKRQDRIFNKHSFHSCSGTTEQQQTHIQHVHHSLQDGSVNRTIYVSAQSLSLSVKMFLHHCQSSLGAIRNIQKTVFPDKTTVLNAALQLVDPYIFTLPSNTSCFYICVIILKHIHIVPPKFVQMFRGSIKTKKMQLKRQAIWPPK